MLSLEWAWDHLPLMALWWSLTPIHHTHLTVSADSFHVILHHHFPFLVGAWLSLMSGTGQATVLNFKGAVAGLCKDGFGWQGFLPRASWVLGFGVHFGILTG